MTNNELLAQVVDGSLTETVELVPSLLYRLGGAVEIDGRFGAYPPDWRGWAPSNCYLLVDGAGALLVDSGFASNEDALLQQLKALVGPETTLSMFFTRPAEFESINNAGAVLSAFSVRSVYARLPMHQMIGFPPQYEPRPEEEDSSWPVGDVDWSIRLAGQPFDVEPARPGIRQVVPVPTPLRKTGATIWLYDERTKTLFTADSFVHVVRQKPGESCVLADGDPDPTTMADVRAALLGKFDWLERADTTVHSDVAKIFDELGIARIAPAHGCVLEGTTTVNRHVDLMLSVLAELTG